MKVLITEFMEAKSVETLKKHFDVTVDQNLSINPKELKTLISRFDILIVRNKTQVNKEILENASNLKFIGRLGVGLDNIDKEKIFQLDTTDKSAEESAKMIKDFMAGNVKLEETFDYSERIMDWY